MTIANGVGDYWDWLAGCLLATRWAGEVHFCGQRRKKSNGERGGVIDLVRTDKLSSEMLARAAAAAHSKAGVYSKPGQKSVEVTFKLNSGNHPFLLVDDLDFCQAHQLGELSGVAIIETSPGNYQASIISPAILSAADIVAAQRGLVRKYGGDPGAVTRSQPRRPPGSINGKPELEVPFCSRLISVNHGMVPADLIERMIELGTVDSIKSNKLQVSRASYVNNSCDDTPSGQDFGWVMHQLTRPVPTRPSDSFILQQLVCRAAGRSRHGLGPDDPRHLHYAKRTLSAARAKLAAQSR